MEEKKPGGFDVLIDLVGKFVERQKGAWDHSAWLNFLMDIQKMGFELSDDMKDYIGSVLESMKKLYHACIASENIQRYMVDIAEYVLEFIKDTGGSWGHLEWEVFLKDLQKKDCDLSEEMRSYIGEVLESVKGLYIALLPLLNKEESKENLKKDENN